VVRRALPCLALAGLSGCAGAQSALDPAGEQAGEMFGLFQLMLAICGVMYGVVLVFLAATVWRARRAGKGGVPAVTPANPGLERVLWGWGAVIVGGLAVLATASFLVERALAAARTRDALEVRVTGHQWWWRIQYRNPVTGGWIETANELHLPLGRTARITLGAADVIHSFWVPNVAGKMDVIPGKVNVIDVSPHRAGWFRGQCAEFCGLQHAHMAFDVKVESAPEFAAWLRRQAAPGGAPGDETAARGQAIVSATSCGLCHTVRGTAANGRAGPDLTHVGARRSIAAGTLPMSRGALQGWIAQPQALKPGTMMPPVPLSGADADAVSAYLAGLQ
jgi:cytochrome c oxidase subunit 2